MSAQREKYVAPSVTETAFNCPHCGALATQTWFTLHADRIEEKDRRPLRFIGAEVDEEKLKQFEDEAERERVREWFGRMSMGAPFLDKRDSSTYVYWNLNNVNVAKCFNCSRVSLWVGNNLAWPVAGDAPVANPDLPEDVRLDYEEASRILNLSPRGAAPCSGWRYRSFARSWAARARR